MSESNNFGLDKDKLRKLKLGAAKKEADFLDSIKALNLPPLDELKPQVLEKDGKEIRQFGHISPNEASKLARISEITGVPLVIIGSGSSNPEKLQRARIENGDTVIRDGVEVARPVGDYDILIDTPDRNTYLRVSGYIEQNIIKEKQAENPDFRADYLFGYTHGFDDKRPHTVFEDGKIKDYSEGSDSYYSLHGGAAKPKIS